MPVLPWYAKTWIGAGDPVWPFFANVFGDKWGAANFISAYHSSYRWGPASFLRYDAHYFLVPFLLLALLALFWIGRARSFPPVLRFFLATGLPYGLLLIENFDAWRLLLPALPALALAAGWWLTSSRREGRASSCLAVILGAIAFVPLAGLTQNNQLFAVLELRSALFPDAPSREVYLRRSLPAYAFFHAVNRSLRAAPCKVLLFPETIGYYLDVDYQWGDSNYQGLIPYSRLPSAEALVRRLAELHITHVLVDVPALGERDPAAASLMRDALRLGGEKLADDGPRALYRLSGTDPGAR